MVILFNVDGESRKAMVKAIENELGVKATYLGVPSCAYQIGGFDRALEMLEMTPNEFIKAAVEYAMEHPAVDPDPIIDIKQVRCYPVYEGETDEEALERQLEKERLEYKNESGEKRDE